MVERLVESSWTTQIGSSAGRQSRLSIEGCPVLFGGTSFGTPYSPYGGVGTVLGAALADKPSEARELHFHPLRLPAGINCF